MFKKTRLPILILASGGLILAIPSLLVIGTYYVGKTVVKTGVKGTVKAVKHMTKEES